MHLMPHISPLQQLPAGTRRLIVAGILFCVLVIVSLFYIFQGLEKLENDSARASEWNAERVFSEFEKFMAVMEQHERYEGLLPQNEQHIRKLELMRPLGLKLKKQFTVLKTEVEKAAKFNNLYHEYVLSQIPNYPYLHQNLLNELRALQPTVFGLTEAGSQYFVRGSSYHDLDIRLKPFKQRLSLVAAVASQQQLEYERERTDRILKLSRYVLIVAALSVFVGLALLILLAGRTRARQKVIPVSYTHLTLPTSDLV